MKLTIPQPALANLIARGGACVQKKPTTPALGMFRLTATDDADNGHALSLASTDHDRFAEATIGATVEVPGTILVPGEALAALIAKHPKTADVSLSLDGNKLVVKAGRSTVRLPTINANTFPTWAERPSESEFKLAGEDFERVFSRVRFAAEEAGLVRPYLQGVCIDATQGDALHFVATDTHRLALSGVAMPEGAETCPRVIVPAETVDAALRIFKGAPVVHVSVSDKAASFAADGLRLSGRLIEGTFPPYEKVIPTPGEHPTASFARGDFVGALERAAMTAGTGPMFEAVRLEPIDGAVRLVSSNASGGEANEEVPCEIAGDFGAFRFNARYAAAFMSTLNVGGIVMENVPKRDNLPPTIILTAPDAPDFIGLLMPVMG